MSDVTNDFTVAPDDDADNTDVVGVDEESQVDESDAERIRSLDKVNVYNPNAGLRPRVGGPYRDQLDLEEAERRRAVIEKREPDYTNMAGATGVPFYTADMMANAFGGGNPAVADMIEANADNANLGPTPVTQVSLVGNASEEVLEVAEEERELRQHGNNEAITSHDQPDVVFTAPVDSSGR